MASYLDRLITLDEDGVENLETGFEAEQTQDITEVIDVDSNNDEINAEAAALEEDIEAMQEGTEAVGELAEQEEVNDELLESPADISPEVAKATNDAFKVTLASLSIDVRDTVYGNITYDSNRNEPIEVVRITNDGVKDFMSKLKEHIIAFFRAIKAKLQKLIAKLFIMFSDVSKKAEALLKEYKNKLSRLGSKGGKIDLDSHSTKKNIISYMPVFFISQDRKIKSAIKAVRAIFVENKSVPYSMEIANEIFKELTATINSTENLGNNVTVEKFISNINTKIKDGQDIYVGKLAKKIEFDEKKDYLISDAVIAGGLFSKTLSVYAFKIHEDADVLIPNLRRGFTMLTRMVSIS